MYVKTNSQNSKADRKGFSPNPDKTKKKKSNYYKLPKGYVVDPFSPFYQNYDVEISDRDDIQQFVEESVKLAEKIEGELDLSELTHQIFLTNLDFVRAGLLAFKIRSLRLYKEEYDNFTDYCHQELGRSRSYIDRLINAARVVVELIQNGFDTLPRNESQCRLLSGLGTPELAKVWKAIVETIEPHKITAESITRFLSDGEEVIEPEDTFIRLPAYLDNHISRHALAAGMTTSDLVVMVLDAIFKPAKPKTNWRDFEREEEWQLDLEKLIEEGENTLNSV